MTNPFKYHIVKYNDFYAIRKLTLIGYVYMCEKLKEWHMKEYIHEYCLMENINDAKKRLSILSPKIEVLK